MAREAGQPRNAAGGARSDRTAQASMLAEVLQTKQITDLQGI